MCALLEKGARAGRSGVVHCVVDRHTVSQRNVLGILTAISKIVSTSAAKCVAPAAWAEISLYTCSVPRQAPASSRADPVVQIGRASCRERGENSAVGKNI